MSALANDIANAGTDFFAFVGGDATTVENNISNLTGWLQNVFWVMGSYIFTTGLLTMYVAQTSFRTRTHGAFVIILIAGITSIGSMTIVNFILQSDFKWMLLSFTFS